MGEQNVQWTAYLKDNPPAIAFWFDNNGAEIPWSSAENSGGKFNATRDNGTTTLEIRDLSLEDSGNYTLHAPEQNKYNETELKFELIVQSNYLIFKWTVFGYKNSF